MFLPTISLRIHSLVCCTLGIVLSCLANIFVFVFVLCFLTLALCSKTCMGVRGHNLGTLDAAEAQKRLNVMVRIYISGRFCDSIIPAYPSCGNLRVTKPRSSPHVRGKTTAAVASVHNVLRNDRVRLHRASTVPESRACCQVRDDGVRGKPSATFWSLSQARCQRTHVLRSPNVTTQVCETRGVLQLL